MLCMQHHAKGKLHLKCKHDMHCMPVTVQPDLLDASWDKSYADSKPEYKIDLYSTKHCTESELSSYNKSLSLSSDAILKIYILAN